MNTSLLLIYLKDNSMSTSNAKMKPSVRKLYEDRLLKAQDHLATLTIARDNLQAAIEQAQDDVVSLERTLADDEVLGHLTFLSPTSRGLTQLCRNIEQGVAVIKKTEQAQQSQSEPCGMIAVPFSHIFRMIVNAYDDSATTPDQPESEQFMTMAAHVPFYHECAQQSQPESILTSLKPTKPTPDTVSRVEQAQAIVQQLNIDDLVIANHLIELLDGLKYDIPLITPDRICELAVQNFEGIHRREHCTPMQDHGFRFYVMTGRK
ncbi:hypothetical protein RISINGSUN_14 [Erwinia phage vB_EamM_RisingSun]|uniref:Uncharacterized protein n=1 Tax=Erwinia phage vB_EamM_RisingSun TaxID=2026080 RepID=A0A223LJC3_9CAUD|nr:hypothetical protein FDI45_gp014 [Erwinia phage vB_EamM_RisingSun]ASU03656.1 hypothetical protein RISINGSUN_14 [Erwinia phage vB_EamM_RisingSun]